MTPQEAALRKVATAQARRERMRAEAQRQLVEAIAAAREAGCSLQQIGDVLGVSHTMVRKMLMEADK